MTALLLLYEPLKRLTRLHNEAQTGLSAARRIFQILDTPPDIEEPPNPVELSKIKGEIEFKDLSFSYEPGREALHDINLKIAPGETLALVGPSGGGKTSLANLLNRFYDPTSGQILLDGVDIKTMGLKFLRSQIALVSQETILFDTTVRENIAYGRPEATEEELTAAAAASLSDGFISELPRGYDEPIGEKGLKLSGGQRQRLAIARAILKDSPVLILDEATSALDTESEKQVQQALDNLSKGRSTLVIAHRLSTVRGADRIAVLRDGRIVEEGRHQELMEKKSEYYRLYNAQHAKETKSKDSGPQEIEALDFGTLNNGPGNGPNDGNQGVKAP
jgi:subfamily B ATP-binding cassette protein MsbA